MKCNKNCNECKKQEKSTNKILHTKNEIQCKRWHRNTLITSQMKYKNVNAAMAFDCEYCENNESSTDIQRTIRYDSNDIICVLYQWDKCKIEQ